MIMKNIFLVILAFHLFNLHSFASQNTEQEIKIYKNLRCLVCQGQSIADSNSDFALTIKSVVRDQIESGKTEKDIYNFLASKYGQWILYEPKFNIYNSLLWFIPYLSLFFGGIIIFVFLKKSKK